MSEDGQPGNQCFHCDLPILLNSPPELLVEDQQQQFCCYGCQSVCATIIASGNGEFYQHRESASPQLEMQNLPALLDKLKIYDKPEVQADFVRSGKNWKQAFLILSTVIYPYY